MLKAISHKLKSVHSNEDGMESLQSVILLALGAMVLVGLHSVYKNNMEGSVLQKLKAMFELNFTTGGGGAGGGGGGNGPLPG